MQTRAIMEAAMNVKRQGIKIHPEIMVPLVEIGEIKLCKQAIEETIAKVFKEQKIKIPYMVGTMIEVPRGPHCGQDRRRRRVLLLRHQ